MRTAILLMILGMLMTSTSARGEERFIGLFFSGTGDPEYLQLLDYSRRIFGADPEFQNLAMLYEPEWNGLVEGPTWDAWWVQNSYGPTLASLPFLEEPFVTFLQNSQDLWFDQMGDGQRKGHHDWVAPDGALCDCARPGRVIYKQGDGKIHLHDWGMEFTAAGVVMQAERLLVSRDREAIDKYLPKLIRCVEFIESRRDPMNNLFLAGPAGNLLAPSYAGWKKPDGAYDMAYLTGLSITYIAALDRMIELAKLAGREDLVTTYIGRRDRAKEGLGALVTDEGYFIMSLDPDGTKHGVFGAAKHGYFESSPNHDAIALRVVDDAQARKIYDKIASIPQLRPHAFILPNYPGYDDMYEEPVGLWSYGTWVNGGHWSTCEARMILAYGRLGAHEDIRASMRQLMKFARAFRMDNPLTEMGNAVYQPHEPINLCYDSFGPPAAMIRGLFQYIYSAESLTLIPSIPDGIVELTQHFPIRFGEKRVYIEVAGAGPITDVYVNGNAWTNFTQDQVVLPFDQIPDRVLLAIERGGARMQLENILDATLPSESRTPLGRFLRRMEQMGLEGSYEYAHARLAQEAAWVEEERRELLTSGKIKPLPEPARSAADQAYRDTAIELRRGLETVIRSYQSSDDPHKQLIYKIWRETHE